MSRHFCDSFFKGTQYGWGLNLGSRWVDGEVPARARVRMVARRGVGGAGSVRDASEPMVERDSGGHGRRICRRSF